MSLGKKSKVILIVLLVGIVAAFAVYKYAMQPPANIESKKADFTLESDAFLSEIQKDYSVYQDKIIVLTGTVTSIEDNGIILNSQIYCQFKDEMLKTSIEENQKITIKGHILGYDDLLEEVKLDECIIQ